MNNTTAGQEKSLSLSEPVKYSVSALFLLMGIGVIILLNLLREPTGRVESDALIPLVDTVQVTDFDGQLDLVVSGSVVPYREIRIGAEVSGRILKKYSECEAGNFVAKGTKLIEIDPEDYLLQIKTMNSEILQAEKTLAETVEEIRGALKSLEIAQTEHKLQRKEFQRFQQLRGSVSETEMDQSKRNMLNSESQLTTRQNTYDMLLARKTRLEASLQLDQNRLEKDKLNLSRTVVFAPEDGVIVRETVEQGDFVTVASELFVFEDTSQAEVVCSLTPGELAWLRRYAPPGTAIESQAVGSSVYQLPRVQVQIYEQTDPTAKWTGILERFDGIGRNEMTKSIPCRIVVADPIIDSDSNPRVLVRGMFVKCQFVVPITNSQINLATFPTMAIRPGDYVWVVRDQKLKRFDVNIIDRTPMADEQMVVVAIGEESIQPGDEVVISPLPQPIDGGRVLLRESTSNLANEPAKKESRQVGVVPTEDQGTKTKMQTDSSGHVSRSSLQDRGAP